MSTESSDGPLQNESPILSVSRGNDIEGNGSGIDLSSDDSSWGEFSGFDTYCEIDMEFSSVRHYFRDVSSEFSILKYIQIYSDKFLTHILQEMGNRHYQANGGDIVIRRDIVNELKDANSVYWSEIYDRSFLKKLSAHVFGVACLKDSALSCRSNHQYKQLDIEKICFLEGEF